MTSIEAIVYLFSLLDDIDSLDDICKSNDECYREAARKIAEKRWKTGITTDGYSLDLSALGDSSVPKNNRRNSKPDKIRPEESYAEVSKTS